jgi:hypothetical protein
LAKHPITLADVNVRFMARFYVWKHQLWAQITPQGYGNHLQILTKTSNILAKMAIT